MGFLDRLFGRDRERDDDWQRRPQQRRDYDYDQPAPRDADQQALERYRYLLRTAPPEAIEQAHEEAFARLTPEQRALALRELSQAVPEHERARGDDPRSLARMATRAELRQPGMLERVFGGGMGMGGGIGLGGMFAGSLFGSLVGSVLGSAVAHEFFDNDPGVFGIDPGGTLGDGLNDLPGGDLLNAQEVGGDLGNDFGDFGDGGGEPI